MPACRNCGTELSEAATVCSNCGTPVQAASQATAGAPSTGDAQAGDPPPGGDAPGEGGAPAGGTPAGPGPAAKAGSPAGPPVGSPPPWPAHQPPPPSTLTGTPTSDERNWAMFAHLTALAQFIGIPWIVGPLIIWLIKRNDSAYIDFHGKEAVNFNISAFLYFTGATVLGSIVGVLTFGLGFIPLAIILVAAGIAWAVFIVIAGIRASQGEGYRYPLTIRFVK